MQTPFGPPFEAAQADALARKSIYALSLVEAVENLAESEREERTGLPFWNNLDILLEKLHDALSECIDSADKLGDILRKV